MSSLPDTVWAWRCTPGSAKRLEKKRIQIPKTPKNGLLVRIKANGVCHSDCTIRDLPGAPPTWAEEFTIGHEGAGEIVDVGPEVDQSSFRIGDTVAIHPIPGCNACPVCKLGYQRACIAPGNGGYGLGRDGLMQEYVAVRADACAKVPEGVPVEHACIAADGMLTAYHAVKYTAAATADQTIAIIGLGGLGLNALQTAHHLGVKRILVLDSRQAALDVAVRLGVDAEDAFCTTDASAAPIAEVLAQRNIVVDTVLDFVGHEQTIPLAQMIVRPIGLIVIVGVISQQGPIMPTLMVQNCLTIKGSFCGTMDGLAEVLQLVKEGVIRPEISTTSIEELPQVLQDLDDGKIRGRKVLLPDW